MYKVTAKRLLNRSTRRRLSQISGYRDIVGNWIADELARQGTIMNLLLGKENVGMPMETCKLNIKNYFNKRANTYWQNAPQCRISHQTWPVISNFLLFYLLFILLGNRPLARWHTCRQAKSPKNVFCRSFMKKKKKR